MTQETIKPQDLRIGNWVAFEGEDSPSKVDAITDTGFINDIKAEWVFGIELSEEILLKCGFEISKVLGTWFCKGNVRVDFGHIKPRIWVIIGVESILLKEQHYLHQLQNLFYALTNEELTINL